MEPGTSRAQTAALPMWPLLAVAVFVLALVAVAAFPAHVFTGDPALFEDRMDELFAGRVPYTGFAYEHLPLAILPMAAAHLIAELVGGDTYNLVFGFLSLGGLLLAALALDRAGAALGEPRNATRWVVLVVPMAPIVIFRLDVWSVALVALGLAWLFAGTGRSVFAFGAGVALKGWPVVMSVALWWRGEKRRAAGLAAFALAMVAVLSLTDGFRAGRSFDGVHQETIAGSLVVASRAIRGIELGLESSAGALYVSVGAWAVVANLALGAALGLLALRASSRRYTNRGAVRLSGALTGALMLASPLLSAQFLLWLTPFVALDPDRANQYGLMGVGAVTTVLLGVWHPTDTWWPLLLVLRNALLLALVVRLVLRAWREGDADPASPRQRAAAARV